MRWAENMAEWEGRACMCFGWKYERNRPLGRPGSRWVEKTLGDERIKTGVNFPGKYS
jgi:hypothetical protein